MNYQYIEYQIENHVARIALNRPQRLNSLTDEMFEELKSAFMELDNSVKSGDVRCLLLTGNGRGFCAGQDLNERVTDGEFDPPDLSESLDKKYNPLIRNIKNLPIPVVCAVNGVAAGAGANIALACDIVVAARSASFIQSFCKVGLVPDAGGSWQLVHRAGRARAMGLAMLGEKISAEKAEQWGLIWCCVDDENLESETRKLTDHLAGQATYSLGLIKQAINAATTNSLDEQLDLERDLQGLACGSEDYKEGVLSFLEKRSPEFKGR